MLCCVLVAASATPIPISAADAAAAADDCNRMTSVVHQGFVVESAGADDMWTCRACARLTESVEGACAPEEDAESGLPTVVPDGRAATRIYDDGVDPSRRDYCTYVATVGWECLACTTGQATGSLKPPPSATVHISSNCSYLVKHTEESPAAGLIQLGSPHMTVRAHGGFVMVDAFPAPLGRSFSMTEATVCPVNASLADCEAGQWQAGLSAMLLSEPGTLSLVNVTSPMTRALLTARPTHVHRPDLRLTSANITGSAQAFVAAFSHVRVAGAFNIECSAAHNRILFQTRRGTDVSEHSQTGCGTPVNIADLLSAYGEHYEVAFAHDGVVKREASQLVKTATKLLIYINVALAVLLVFGHEGDIRRLMAAMKK